YSVVLTTEWVSCRLEAVKALCSGLYTTKMTQRGRPRSFDRQAALRQAMQVFWALGYEGATLNELQEAMGGIAPTSFYAAFGSKEELFREAVELYSRT